MWYYKLLNKKLLPSDNVIPPSYRKAYIVLKDIKVEYDTYHVRINDYILYRGPYEKLSTCVKYGVSRYQKEMKGKNIPRKKVHHIQINPRLM